MTRQHQLETTLRSLGLSGMLDTLAARLQQANGGQLGHLEFLQTLCEDEIIRRDTAALARRVKQADDLYELITERGRRSLVLTANRVATDCYPLFPNPVVAESILDRVINTAHHVHMNGRSYRPDHRPGRVRKENP